MPAGSASTAQDPASSVAAVASGAAVSDSSNTSTETPATGAPVLMSSTCPPSRADPLVTGASCAWATCRARSRSAAERDRSEERRVGKEWSGRWLRDQKKKSEKRRDRGRCREDV